MRRADALPNDKFISTGLPTVDSVLGGGLRRGAITELFGESGTGKSALALRCLGEAQRAGLTSCLVDLDGSYDTRLGNKVLDESSLLYIKPKNLGFWDDICRIVDYLDVLVLDGINCISTVPDLSEPEAVGLFLNRAVPVLYERVAYSDCAVLITNHVTYRTRTLGTPGGVQLKRLADVRLHIVKMGRIHNRDGSVAGISSMITAIKNRYSIPTLGAYVNVRAGELEDCGPADWS